MSPSPLSRLNDPLEGSQWLPFDGAAKQLQLSRVTHYSFLFRRLLERAAMEGKG
jgi:hypothetical protein